MSTQTDVVVVEQTGSDNSQVESSVQTDDDGQHTDSNVPEQEECTLWEGNSNEKYH